MVEENKTKRLDPMKIITWANTHKVTLQQKQTKHILRETRRLITRLQRDFSSLTKEDILALYLDFMNLIAEQDIVSQLMQSLDYARFIDTELHMRKITAGILSYLFLSNPLTPQELVEQHDIYKKISDTLIQEAVKNGEAEEKETTKPVEETSKTEE